MFNICQTFSKFSDLIGILLRRMCHSQGNRISSGHSTVLFLPHYLNCWLVLPEPLVFFLVWERLRLAFSFAAKFPRTLKLYLNFITVHQGHNIRILNALKFNFEFETISVCVQVISKSVFSHVLTVTLFLTRHFSIQTVLLYPKIYVQSRFIYKPNAW